MTETLGAFNESPDSGKRPYPADDLAGFRWHTGATLRPLTPGEPCPVLFRDVGPAALATFLRGGLRRLAGPLSPLVYLRTVDYLEPYTDFEATGRLMVLQPLSLHPWHSGTPHVFVARSRPGVDRMTVVFVPGEISLAEASRLAGEVSNVDQWREALGGRAYDEAVVGTVSGLDRLGDELARAEVLAAPLRGRLQSSDRSVRERARAEMERMGLTETDLCSAWHHLPRERRGWIVEALHRVNA
jgi:hypothetical protein